jgi:HEPN domain-containing protein
MPPDTGGPPGPRAWLRRARSNLARARAGRPDSAVLLDDLCFDAQQAAEKALKALIIHRGLLFPKVHDLAVLLTMIEQCGVTVPAEVRECDRLSGYAVEGRYPGLLEDVSEEEYREALRLAESVVEWVVSHVE